MALQEFTVEDFKDGRGEDAQDVRILTVRQTRTLAINGTKLPHRAAPPEVTSRGSRCAQTQ